MTSLVLVALSLAVCTATTGASTSQPGEMIAFSTNRAQNLYRAGIYSVREDGKQRRLISLPTPPASSIVRSPGGRRILFTRQVDGKLALFASDLSGANAVRLTPPDLEPDRNSAAAAFSPDGRKVAFTSFEGCGYRCGHATLWVVDAGGSGLHRISDNASLPSWAPDGQRLAYSGPDGIYVADPDGRQTTNIGARGYRPVWAPRGNRIAYNVTAGGFGVLCLVDSDGSHRRCLRGRSAKKPLWSPDARWVAFEQVTPARLAVVGAGGRGLRYLERRSGVRGRGNVRFPVAWSPDGRQLAFVGRYYSDVYVRNVFGLPAVRQVTHEAQSSSLSDIRWRGRRISFSASRLQNDYELASMQADGSDVRVLTHNSDDDLGPNWSPDGRTIVFSRRTQGLGVLRLIEADGSRDRPLTEFGQWRDSSPSWSPDGLRVAFVRATTSQSNRLMIVNRDGSGLQQISSMFVYDRISWSPDGRSIVVSAVVGYYGVDLFVVAVDGSGSRQVMTGHRAEAPAWSPDGTRILFAGDVASPPSKTGRDLFTIRPDGTGLTHIVEDAASPAPGSAWAPNGLQIAFTRDASGFPYPQRSSIAVVGADGHGLRDLTDNYSSNVDPAWSR